jgi:hypothetical protein
LTPFEGFQIEIEAGIVREMGTRLTDHGDTHRDGVRSKPALVPEVHRSTGRLMHAEAGPLHAVATRWFVGSLGPQEQQRTATYGNHGANDRPRADLLLVKKHGKWKEKYRREGA